MWFEELQLNTTNLIKVEQFYVELLQLELIDKRNDCISIKIGKSILKFKLINSTHQPHYHFAINIPSNKINEAANWMEKKLNLLVNTDQQKITQFTNWNAESIYFYDYNENIIELICRHDLENDAILKFDQKSLLSINEVGIATRNPQLVFEQINAYLNFPKYTKGPYRNDFIAQGYEDCLFVISSNQRNWYPTNDLAEICPISVKINDYGITKTFEINFGH